MSLNPRVVELVANGAPPDEVWNALRIDKDRTVAHYQQMAREAEAEDAYWADEEDAYWESGR